jgi:hypothetical protein
MIEDYNNSLSFSNSPVCWKRDKANVSKNQDTKKKKKKYKISKWVFIFEESVRNETEDSRIFHCDVLANTWHSMHSFYWDYPLPNAEKIAKWRGDSNWR